MYNGSERRSWSINQWMKKMANFLRIICIYISNLMQRQRVSYFTIITVTEEECMLESWSRELPFPFISLHFWTKSFTNWNFCVPVTCEYVYVVGLFFSINHVPQKDYYLSLSSFFFVYTSICKSIACLSLVIICMWIFIYILLHFLKR